MLDNMEKYGIIDLLELNNEREIIKWNIFIL